MYIDLNVSLGSNGDTPIDDDNMEENNCAYSASGIEMKLSVNSEFDGDIESVYSLYNEYARCKGFSIRRGHQDYFRGSKVLNSKYFYCSCEDIHDNKRSEDGFAEYKKQVTRCNCTARLRVVRKLGKKWRVSIFLKEHNHELVPPGVSYLLRSSRHIRASQKAALEKFNTVGVGVSRACSVMEFEVGGPENVGFIRSDAYTHMSRVRMVTKVENVDSNALLEFFTEQSNKEPYFFWKAQLDDDGRLMNFFFRDTRSETDYKAFGDVLSVDTTYRTNRYNLVCAPFVGINHHRRNVMFAIAFLSDETSKSFEWLFSTFLESMHGREPQVVFSDQCQALMNGVDYTFQTARHRLCQWHINQNAPAHFGSLNGNTEFKSLWHRCMNGCETEEEFELLWLDMLETYGLHENRWFRKMYNLRERWASVFTQTLFSAGLRATSRSEATNRVLKDLCKKSASLHDFVMRFQKIQSDWRRTEREDDAICFGTPGQLMERNRLLIHAAKVYTRRVFKKFLKEAAHSLNIDILQHPSDDGASDLEYIVTSDTPEATTRMVSYNTYTHQSSCTCHMWETIGILCQHILKIYYLKNVHSLPEGYILRRWTKDAKHRGAETPAIPVVSKSG